MFLLSGNHYSLDARQLENYTFLEFDGGRLRIEKEHKRTERAIKGGRDVERAEKEVG